ncbi:site-specific integrase [Bradyrhizobium sp. th.b2]|uniref:tyrosine-type recombinase/integrase n=1 Tax=Bradyrhizobium sp. th-b2 TaxID=172088 RepID=UPI0003FF9E7B|nr:site-specific integrase [Bradyrhizobium sp. th.b2]
MKGSRRSHGDGSIDRRGEDVYRLRYRVNGQRFTKTFHGSLSEARKELRALLRAGDTGEHVDPSKLTVGQWIDQWLRIGAPGRKQEEVSERTKERYAQLVNEHVKPVLGHQPLQKLQATEIDRLYTELKAKISPWTKRPLSQRTQRHVHVVLGATLATAVRTGLLSVNPMTKTAKKPKTGDGRPGIALDETDLAKLVTGFKSSPLFRIVALTASTGMRRNEVLALRWTDLDAEKKTLRIERAWEPTKKHGMTLKPPKTARGLRTIDLDDGTLALLLHEKERYQRIKAGVPDAAEVNLSLVKLPADALMFPAVPAGGRALDLARPRDPWGVSKAFRGRAKKLGFTGFTFHMMRHTHSTMLLDKGMPVHRVAARIGDDPATLLRVYAQLTKKKSTQMSDVVNALGTAILGPT